MFQQGITGLLEQLKSELNSNECDIYSGLTLTPGEFRFLSAAAKSERLSCAELRKDMGISPSRFSRIVDRLVESGFLIRTADRKDRRNINLAFTEAGRKMLDNIETKKQNCEDKITRGFSEKQIETIKESLSLLINGFQNNK